MNHLFTVSGVEFINKDANFRVLYVEFFKVGFESVKEK